MPVNFRIPWRRRRPQIPTTMTITPAIRAQGNPCFGMDEVSDETDTFFSEAFTDVVRTIDGTSSGICVRLGGIEETVPFDELSPGDLAASTTSGIPWVGIEGSTSTRYRVYCVAFTGRPLVSSSLTLITILLEEE